uniref:Uncharacterized protein n=1 Tax=uncultured prokaryote TaxID=198431 RepID=A0A0H5QJZ7_9ZZZZ|nr:hypothetical protein [uncultured prokaryote]
MPYPAGVIKYVMSGTMPGGEIFSTGFQTKVDGTPTLTQLDAGLGLINAWFATTPATSMLHLQGGLVKYTKLSAYGYAGGSTADSQSEGPVNFGGSALDANFKPNQCTMVATLGTGRPGRSRRGRMYLPLNGCTLADYQVPNTEITIISVGIASLLQSFLDGTASGLPQTPVVASSTHSYTTDITTVSVDSRYDVQRRRAESEAILRQVHTDLT